jgi:hypothetical protein
MVIGCVYQFVVFIYTLLVLLKIIHSMMCHSDTVDPVTKLPQSRWSEAKLRLKEMIEILAHVPFQQIGIEFLNRKDRIGLTRNGMTPTTFLARCVYACVMFVCACIVVFKKLDKTKCCRFIVDILDNYEPLMLTLLLLLLLLYLAAPLKSAYQKIDAVFARTPSGTTPALEKLQESFMRGQGVSIARYFFGDGLPNGGTQAVDAIVRLLKNRAAPESNPFTFISCTNEDEAVEVCDGITNAVCGCICVCVIV